MKHAVIFGCGPAGLLAAWAAESSGYDITVISKRRKSEMFGAQYLHDRIPGITPVDNGSVEIRYQLAGTIEGYRKKVYGQNWTGTVSADEFSPEEGHHGWNLRHVYDALWLRYQDRIQSVLLKHGGQVQEYVDAAIEGTRFISTIPAPFLCIRQDEHVFRAQKVWAIGDAPERGVFCPVTHAPANTIIMNGERDVSWYRNANIFGYRTAEWPEARRPPYDGVALVEKPLSTTCSCLDNVLRAGRYGKWQKGVLAHQAYYETMAELAP